MTNSKSIRNYIFYVVTGITTYRLMAAVVLFFLVLKHEADTFKWFLLISFVTDLVDGFLARRFKVESVYGAKLDSIADDLTIVAGIAGIIVLKPGFFLNEIKIALIPLGLYFTQLILAIARYKKPSSFHTYTAKLAALLQGVFLILLFFLKDPVYWLFYLTITITVLDLLEEIVLIFLLPVWKINVKGLYWELKDRAASST